MAAVVRYWQLEDGQASVFEVSLGLNPLHLSGTPQHLHASERVHSRGVPLRLEPASEVDKSTGDVLRYYKAYYAPLEGEEALLKHRLLRTGEGEQGIHDAMFAHQRVKNFEVMGRYADQEFRLLYDFQPKYGMAVKSQTLKLPKKRLSLRRLSLYIEDSSVKTFLVDSFVKIVGESGHLYKYWRMLEGTTHPFWLLSPPEGRHYRFCTDEADLPPCVETHPWEDFKENSLWVGLDYYGQEESVHLEIEMWWTESPYVLNKNYLEELEGYV